MANDIPKVCPTCKHFYFSPGERGYSTLTPGSSMYITCEKDYWSLDEDDSDLTYRKKMLMALTCPDYELVKL
jgi:hypothetical protein